MEKTNEINKKNKVFLILSFFGIVFVVLGHLNDVNIGVNILFPYYSFHMALFAFVSGYFFKDITKKCSKIIAYGRRMRYNTQGVQGDPCVNAGKQGS